MDPGYGRRTRASGGLFRRAQKVFAGGVNHNARFFEPYPLFISKARGKNIWDEDGNKYADYWMGHLALILGHSPKVVVDAITDQVQSGTHFGASSRLSVELGEEIQKTVPCAEMMRFCNTGAEATMYLVRLARGFTRRKTVIKISGGWHGYNTELNKGVHSPFAKTEGMGILKEEQAHIVTARFNDLESARSAVRKARGDAALILLEPVLGAGGCIPAKKEYLAGLREIADSSGCILAFDEIITGYRVSLGGAQERYGVIPDLAALGKVAGGGLPLGLVCGRKEILAMADPTRRDGFVSIGGGTFSENPLSMVAGLATIRYLRRNANAVYPRLEALGEEIRNKTDSVMTQNGLETHTTGMGSLFLTHFGPAPSRAEDTAKENPNAAREYARGMMSKGVYLLPGHPCGISVCHERRDIERFAEFSESVASTILGSELESSE